LGRDSTGPGFLKRGKIIDYWRAVHACAQALGWTSIGLTLKHEVVDQRRAWSWYKASKQLKAKQANL
jgi:hypothetical protein